MANYFKISGYWKGEDDSEFSDYIVTDIDNVDEENDDLIFFYGLSENELKEAVELGENTALEFVITSYELTSL
jgi:hypothetical protein